MARIYPFRAVRYNTMDVPIGDVVTQPYDKITPSMQQAYYAHNPYNLVRIILGLPELFDAPGENDVYTRAKDYFQQWQREGVLYRENEPCIFAYAQRFTEPGTGVVKERRSFIALGEVREYAQGVIFRHEQTLAKPKYDRMQLLQATRAHFGQLFMLYSDPALTVERSLFGPSFRAEIEVTDEYGVLHQLAQGRRTGYYQYSRGSHGGQESSSSLTDTIVTRRRWPIARNTRPHRCGTRNAT